MGKRGDKKVEKMVKKCLNDTLCSLERISNLATLEQFAKKNSEKYFIVSITK